MGTGHNGRVTLGDIILWSIGAGVLLHAMGCDPYTTFRSSGAPTNYESAPHTSRLRENCEWDAGDREWETKWFAQASVCARANAAIAARRWEEL